MNFKVVLEPFSEFILGKSDFSYRKMRFLGRIPFFRNAGFDFSFKDKLKTDPLEDLTTAPLPSEIVEELSIQGFSSTITLSQELLSEIENQVSNTPFVNLKTGKGEFYLNNNNLINPGDAYLYNLDNPHLENSELNRFASTTIKPIADAYLGANSKVLNTQIWASFSDENNTYNPDFGFHYDLDDYRFLKLFIYLTDVNEDNGPHQIIAKSHKFNAFYRFFNRRLEEPLSKQYESNVNVMLGKKGDGFFEDTLCYHKGTRPLKPRMILQVQYGISNLADTESN